MGVISEHEYRYNMTMKVFHSHPEPAFETRSQQEDMGSFGDSERGWYWRGNMVPSLDYS